MLPLIQTLARKHLAGLATATLLAVLPLTTQAQTPSIVVASNPFVWKRRFAISSSARRVASFFLSRRGRGAFTNMRI